MKITLEQISGWEKSFLVIVLVFLTVILIIVLWQACDLMSMATDFEQRKLAYDSAVVQTFVQPFNKIIGAFVVYAFGKLGVKVLDNYITLKHANKDDEIKLKRISIFP